MDDDRGAGTSRRYCISAVWLTGLNDRDSVSETYRSVVTCLDILERQQQSRDGQTMSRLRIYNALSMSLGEMNPVEMPY